MKINGDQRYLWRAVDHAVDVLESFVTMNRHKRAALNFLMKAMIEHSQREVIVTDKLWSYGAAFGEFVAVARQETGQWLNNRAENSRRPFQQRERAMLRVRQIRSFQRFAAEHASVSNHFNQERSLSSSPPRQIVPLSLPSGLESALYKGQTDCPSGDEFELG